METGAIDSPSQPSRTQGGMPLLEGKQVEGDPAHSAEYIDSSTVLLDPSDGPAVEDCLSGRGGYIDLSTMSEEQQDACRELEQILATTPFTGTGRIVELMPGFYLSNGR